MSEALLALETKLSAAKESSRELDAEIEKFHLPGSSFSTPRYTSCLDAAVALTSEMLPGWQIALRFPFKDSGRARAEIASIEHMPLMEQEQPDLWYQFVNAPTPALALCLATIRALISRTALTQEGE